MTINHSPIWYKFTTFYQAAFYLRYGEYLYSVVLFRCRQCWRKIARTLCSCKLSGPPGGANMSRTRLFTLGAPQLLLLCSRARFLFFGVLPTRFLVSLSQMMGRSPVSILDWRRPRKIGDRTRSTVTVWNNGNWFAGGGVTSCNSDVEFVSVSVDSNTLCHWLEFLGVRLSSVLN